MTNKSTFVSFVFIRNWCRVAGFSIVEMVVSVSIVALVMAVILFSYSKFNDNLALGAAGQELAIAVRQAQVYGLTVKEVSVNSGNFNTAYGAYFDLNDLSNYYIFADTNGDKVYNVGSGCGSGSTECIEKIALRNGVKISQICDGVSNCPPGPGGSVTNLDITFLRPNPDATINFANSGGNIKATTLTGKVVLISPRNKTLTVTIESTGQVLVQ